MNAYPSTKVLRKMGFNADQDGILRRYHSEKGGWDIHLNETKNFINQCVEQEKPENIGVLGSGWLLDVPIDNLLEKSKNIYLYDIRHPKKVMKKYQNHSNIHFVNTDITGGYIEYTYNAIRNKTIAESIEYCPESIFCPAEPLDYLVSVNVLNQLDILILENLRRPKKLKADLISNFRKKIQSNHLKLMSTDSSCLITDFEEDIYDRKNTFIESNSLLYTQLPESKWEKQWIWNFDSQMSYYPNRRTYFKVIAKQY